MKEINIPTPSAELRGYPKITKSGIITAHGSEMSLFIYHGKLMYLDASNLCAVDYFTGEKHASIPDGLGTYFAQAFCENDVVSVFATKDNHVYRFVTEDLEHWTDGEIVVTFPDIFELFNTAVCKGEDGYIMAIECAAANDDPFPGRETERVNKPNPWIGEKFTEFFASSKDLKNWELLPLEKSYTQARYNACPALKYCEGYYYMFCLEAMPCYRFAPYIYRTKDFETWELGYYNPLFVPSQEDYEPKAGVSISEAVIAENRRHVNTNNSDLDLCEYEGKTYIVYCSGNQGVTTGGLNCEAVYDGPINEFLKANFS